MTKANERAIANMKDAERRARRKVKRLQKKGVRTGNILPFREVDTSNTRAVNKYVKELEKFVSRETRFVAGHEGTPIPYSTWRQYKQLEKKWNVEHDKYWGKFGAQPFITSQGPSEMSMAHLSSVSHVKGLPYGDIGYKKELQPGSVRGVKDLQKRMDIIKTELSPSYKKKRVQELRKNLLGFVGYFNDPELESKIKGLTNQQLFMLQDFTDFVEIFYHHYIPGSADQDLTLDDLELIEQDNQREHMLLTIQQVKQIAPRGKTKKKKPRKRK